jgi:hypothetical protein
MSGADFWRTGYGHDFAGQMSKLARNSDRIEAHLQSIANALEEIRDQGGVQPTAVTGDHVFRLPSGTELSLDAAHFDLGIAMTVLAEVRAAQNDEMNMPVQEDFDSAISDLDHVRELLRKLLEDAHFKAASQ